MRKRAGGAERVFCLNGNRTFISNKCPVVLLARESSLDFYYHYSGKFKGKFLFGKEILF